MPTTVEQRSAVAPYRTSSTMLTTEKHIRASPLTPIGSEKSSTGGSIHSGRTLIPPIAHTPPAPWWAQTVTSVCTHGQAIIMRCSRLIRTQFKSTRFHSKSNARTRKVWVWFKATLLQWLCRALTTSRLLFQQHGSRTSLERQQQLWVIGTSLTSIPS